MDITKKIELALRKEAEELGYNFSKYAGWNDLNKNEQDEYIDQQLDILVQWLINSTKEFRC